MNIILIGCSKKKQDYPCPAYNMYTGVLFQRSLEYALTLTDTQIFILSANYGLLKCMRNIVPYDITLKRMRKQRRIMWSKRVVSALARECSFEKDNFILLAGRLYIEHIVPYLKNYQTPLKGLGYGRSVSLLNKLIRSN